MLPSSQLVQGLEAQLQEYEQEMGCSVSFETPALSHVSMAVIRMPALMMSS